MPDFSTSYTQLVLSLLGATLGSSSDHAKLLENSSDFLCTYLGYETANFLFFDPDSKALTLFHQALSNGLDMPFFWIKKMSRISSWPKEFDAAPRSANEKSAFRSTQSRIMKDPAELSTVQLALKNLDSRRSRSEQKDDWLLITSGERAIFCFEWLVWSGLLEKGVNTKESARQLIMESDFIRSRWAAVYEGNTGVGDSFPNMIGRGLDDYRAALTWLGDLDSTESRSEHSYLWAEGSPRNWFISGRRPLSKLLPRKPHLSRTVNYGLLKRLAFLVVEHSEVDWDAGPIGLESARFYERSRVSPSMALELGSHNVIIFRLTMMPVGEAESVVDAFLLGTFFHAKTCVRYAAEIKSIFYLLAARDVFRFSMKRLASATARNTQINEFLVAINDLQYTHEITGPLARIKDTADKIRSLSKRQTSFDLIDEQVSKIEGQCERGRRAANNLQGATSALIDKTSEFEVSETVEAILRDIKGFMYLPEGADVRFRNSLGRRLKLRMVEESLYTILTNLVQNSLDALAGPGVVRVILEEREKGWLDILVKDNGRGISKAYLPDRLFEKFETTKRKTGKGGGLGLYICKRLVEWEGGILTAENLPERSGALFRVRMPIDVQGGDRSA